MFEGLVRQLLVGYLGRYIKDIQKEKLKITLWNEEVLLENVELILEAFDYLQLPFALKQGRVGRLSIKIPWKKLGWDPIIISLEDVFVCASQRDDEEWSLDAVERREFAGKKARLAAAELAKLSRRVCDNHAGQSFISYITTRVLDSIQISIKKFHVMYYDVMANSGHIMVGIKFSSLTIMKQIPAGFSGGWVRGAQVNKCIEIIGLEIYCSTLSGAVEKVSLDSPGELNILICANSESRRYDSVLAPCDLSISLAVSKSGKLDNNVSQYSIDAQLSNLVISFDEIQLQQIIVLWDYLCTCGLRNKYGRFRPLPSSLSRKIKGWQLSWWHYAQESVLSDVRKKLKKTSWRYFGQRLSYRRRYRTLYKTKLEFLRQDQSVDDNVLLELEQMEKESDIDDILSYRSAAEIELQCLFNSSTSGVGADGVNMTSEMSRTDERPIGKTRGWLNWLSRGMLGAGGTDDSSQFSGVISDEVIKDIYEATEFPPPVSSIGDASQDDKICFCAIKLGIHQISAELRSMKYAGKVAEIIFSGTVTECRIWDESASITIFVSSAEIVNPCDQRAMLLMRRRIAENSVPEIEHSCCSFQIDSSPSHEVNLSVKVMFQPVEATWDMKFFLLLVEVFDGLKSYKLLPERVLSSLNGIENVDARLKSKAECILSTRKKVMWDINIIKMTIYVPWRTAVSGQCNLLLELGSIHLASKNVWQSISSSVREKPKSFSTSFVSFDIPLTFELQDLYDDFEVKLIDFQMKMMMPFHPQEICILEKFSASVDLGSCLIPDEPLLKRLEVFVHGSSLHAHFSPSIYGTILGLIENLQVLPSKPENEISASFSPDRFTTDGRKTPVFGLSISVSLQSVNFRVDLENDGENSSAVTVALDELETRYALTEFEECQISVKTLNITVHPLRGKGDGHVLYTCANISPVTSAHQCDVHSQPNDRSGVFKDMNTKTETCFLLHLKSNNADLVGHRCTIYLNETDIHCYPYVISLLIGFYERCFSSFIRVKSFSPLVNCDYPKPWVSVGFQNFGISNFSEIGSSECAKIPFNYFPFVTIKNSGFLGNLESSLIHTNPDWRKRFKIREKGILSPKFSLNKGLNVFHAQASNSEPTEAPTASRNSSHTNLSVIDFIFYGIRVHFHDSSCILGSVLLPNCKSSLFIYEDSMDLLCSIEGLTLTSSWWTQNFREFLWGPALPHLSPILNIRVRKENIGPLSSQLEISMSVQHVYCILPPEYLAILVGYFSLSDWTPYLDDRSVPVGHGYTDSEEQTSIIYKFEILDSILSLPVENELQFLKVELKQLYLSFSFGSSLNDALRDVPPEYLVPNHKIAYRNDCLNIFGRDLCLSYLLFEADRYGRLMADQGPECRNITLVASLSADVWVRIPCENESISESSLSTVCVMTRIVNCEVISDDADLLCGFEALVAIITQLSSVPDQCKCFRTDVLQFLQLKRSIEEESAVSLVASSMIFTEVKCSVNLLSIKLHRLRNDLMDVIAKAEMQLTCSILLNDDNILSMDFCFSSVLLYSNSILLAQCTSKSLSSPVLNISFSRSDQAEDEVHICLPSLDIWLHLSEWTEVIDLLNQFTGQITKTADVDVSEKFPSESIHPSKFSPADKQQASLTLSLRSEVVGIRFHFPLFVREAHREFEVKENIRLTVRSNMVEERYVRYIVVTLHCKNSGVFIHGRNVKLKSDMEKLNGKVSICEETSIQFWPLFEISEVNLEAEISSSEMKNFNVKMEVQCDQLEIWLSHHVFYFWHDFEFKLPEAGSSQFIFCCVELEIRLRKISFLLSDGRWSSYGSLLEILINNFLLHANVSENNMENFISGDLQVNYNNIQKVFWEPFIEPWQFEMIIISKHDDGTLLNSSVVTDISLVSIVQLNVNLTESLTECLSRIMDMIKEAWGSRNSLNFPYGENISAGRYAPYILQNLTSLPILYHVYRGTVDLDEFDVSNFKGEYVQPGSSAPIYTNKSLEEQLFHRRSSHSSEFLNELKTKGAAHHFISIQLDGTSVPSTPISMDLVGQTYFEVDFSKALNKEIDKPKDASGDIDNIKDHRTDAIKGFIVPVVFDVSVQRYSKLIRLYSTVILFNTTSKPLELRFDIPFGVSPTILDPLYPGQEMPLPLHLAEAGRMRWRPAGKSYLWSEAYNLSNLLAQESKIGSLRSIVCYPVHPSSDPFRCCISVRNIVVPSFSTAKIKSDLKQPVVGCGHIMHNLSEQKKLVHQVTLSSPLTVKNYLPEEVRLILDTGGVTHTATLSEVETFFHHIDPSHDLTLQIQMRGFRPSALKFPRAETFCSMAKFGGTKFSLSETISLNPDLSNGAIYIAMEKTMDAVSGSRELGIFVPFLLYNCTGIPLFISESADELKGVCCIIPSCYDMDELDVRGKRDGLSLLSSSNDPYSTSPDSQISLRAKNIVSTRENAISHSCRFLRKPLLSSCSLENYQEKTDKYDSCKNTVSKNSKDQLSSSDEFCTRHVNSVDFEHGKVRAFMYSPNAITPANEVMVRVCRPLPECCTVNMQRSSWSSPFYLIPPSGSTTVLVPQSLPNTAFVISVTSSAVAGPFAERTSAITFQPRYVISNACSKDLCYKQKGTDFIFRLGIGEHSHLEWTDTTRELLVSVSFDEPGWQWSGGFFPDHLGDTQVKMRNYVTGSLNIIRIEVQNADVSIEDEKIVGSLHGNSGTNLILLSDDDTGYMPYRIDNFTKERLRIYQQRCESFETIVHSYTSCPYAWDEPCYPHRLTVEVPGERVLGLYSLDDVKDYIPVHLSSTTEKPGRTFHLSVHAEGATKVLSIVDSGYHILSNMKDPSIFHVGEKRKHEQKREKFVDYKQKISVVIPYIGLSMINSYPEELVFTCVKNITLDLLQSLDQQKFSLKILSLQIDNQFRNTQHPVILSFDHEYRSNPAGNIRIMDDTATIRSERISQMNSDNILEPVLHLTLSKWRKTDSSLVSFGHISLRIADFRIEVEQQVILSLFEFFRNVSSRFQGKVIPFSDPLTCPLVYGPSLNSESSAKGQTSKHFDTREDHVHVMDTPMFSEIRKHGISLPSIVPIGAPWQQIYLLARRQKKVYVELLDLAPIKFTLSFSSAPWMMHNRVLTSGELLIHRGLMALADIDGARIHLKQLTIAHHMASWESIQEILIRHYTRQLLHEMYKVFGSAGVIGNPMGFARSMGVGIRDFLSVPAKSILESPTGLITGVAQGTTSLLSNTVYAISDAATQFSKAAQKGIVAFTFDDHAVSRIGKQQSGVSAHSEGVINEVLEGLTGLLQSPIRGAEKHGLPGVLSGIALGITGLVAKPTASILEVTGKTAQSIRNRSSLYQTGQQRFRVRLPRSLSRELPLRPFSWEEAVGTSVLLDADDSLKLKDEVLVICKALKQAGKFVIITERLLLIVSCSSLVDLGKPEFRGIPADCEWVIESEIGLESVIHAGADGGVLHLVGSSSDSLPRQNQNHPKRGGGIRTVQWDSLTPLPLFQTNLEMAHEEDAEYLLQVLLSTVDLVKERGWRSRYVLHRYSAK